MTETLPGWKIERRDDRPFKLINITAPNGYSSTVGSHERNPMNVLYMLADALLTQASRAQPDFNICPACGGLAADPIVPPGSRAGIEQPATYEVWRETAPWYVVSKPEPDEDRHSDAATTYRLMNIAASTAWEAAWHAALAAASEQAASRPPVAFAVFAPNGNIRLWSTDSEAVRKFAAERGLPVTPLVASMPAPPKQPLTFSMLGPKLAFTAGVQTFTLDYEPESDEDRDFMERMLRKAWLAAAPEPSADYEACAALDDLRRALAFLDQVRAAPPQEKAGTGALRDAREWLERAARAVAAQ